MTHKDTWWKRKILWLAICIYCDRSYEEAEWKMEIIVDKKWFGKGFWRC